MRRSSLLAILLICAIPGLAQDNTEECPPGIIANLEVLLDNAQTHWVGGNQSKAIDVAYQAWQLCTRYVPGALEYTDFLTAYGLVNSATALLESLEGGYPRAARPGVGQKISAIQSRFGAFSVVVRDRSGFPIPLDVIVEIDAPGLTPAEERQVHEVENLLLTTPAHPGLERPYFLPPGRYSLRVILDDDDYPSPESLPRTDDGRLLLTEHELKLSPGKMERVMLDVEHGGDHNNLMLVIVGGLAWLMFR